MPWTPPPAPTSLSNHLAIIVGAMRGALAARCAKDRAAAPLILLAWTRLGRLAARFERLMAQVRAGRLPAAPVVRRRAPAVPRRFRPPGVPQPLRLPRGFGWLLRLVRETAAFSGQVETLLADPEMAALLATSPQARRILRPLCHMLAIRPGPALSLPRRRKQAAEPAAATPDPDPSRTVSPSARPPDTPRRAAGVRAAVFVAEADPLADPPPGLPAPA